MGTAHIDPEKLRSAAVIDVFVVGVGQDGTGTSVRTKNVDFQVFNSRMFHLDANVEDIVSAGDEGAGREFGEGYVGAVVCAVRRTADAIRQEDGVAHFQCGMLRVPNLLQYNVV